MEVNQKFKEAKRRLREDVKIIAGPLIHKYHPNLRVGKTYFPPRGYHNYLDVLVSSKKLFVPSINFDTGITYHQERSAVEYKRQLPFQAVRVNLPKRNILDFLGIQESILAETILAGKEDFMSGLLTLALVMPCLYLNEEGKRSFPINVGPDEEMRDFSFHIEKRDSDTKYTTLIIGGGYTPEIAPKIGSLLRTVDDFIDNPSVKFPVFSNELDDPKRGRLLTGPNC